MFNLQTPGKGWDFPALTNKLALKQDAFPASLTAGGSREEVIEDRQDGFKLGITSIPTFFISGRPLARAYSIATFQALIEMLLKEQPLS